MDITTPLRRRTLIAGALTSGLLLSAGLSPERAPAQTPRRVPRTLSAAGRAGAVQRPGFRVHHLGITWSGPADPGQLRLHYRDGWRSEPRLGSRAAGGHAAGQHTSLLYVGDADAYQLVPGDGVSDVQVYAINTVDGPDTRQPSQDIRQMHGWRYLSRAGWGADESLRFAPDGTEIFPPAFFDVQTLTVHHTVTVNSDPDPAATVRAIYFLHAVTNTWGDIGYHLLIDDDGVVYEGRYSGPDSVPVFGPRKVGPNPSMCNAAHVAGFNAGNVGVALLGDLTATGPTPAARRSLVAVLAVLSKVTDLDPLGTTSYVNPINQTTRTVPTIAGHRDWAATECPGNTFYPLLPGVRREVAAALS
jgi:hypothetical protein